MPEWSLVNLPPKNHADVADFAYNLFEIARREKERLKKPDDFLFNYSLYRGKTDSKGRKAGNSLVNLYFANIERTVSNITARNPVGEVVDLDGETDDAEKILTMALKKWWQDSGQQKKTRTSARSMEIYGVTFEKPWYDKDKGEPNIDVSDPFSVFPAPGNYENIDTECPFLAFAYLDFVDKVETEFKVKGVGAEEAYELLGLVREEYKSTYAQPKTTIGNYSDKLIESTNQDSITDGKIERCLLIEVWVRDNRETTQTEEAPEIDPTTGMPATDEDGNVLIQQVSTKQKAYPDGVRKITIVKSKADKAPKNKSGYIVLDDSANPNINPALPIELAQVTHPWSRFPVYHANSYKSLIDIWGFAASEQTADLIIEINKLINKLSKYAKNVMEPPLIIQRHCGITREMVESDANKGGRLVLMPTTPNARIEFMQIPNLPQSFFEILNMLVGYFDRVYQIEDADRGEAPKGVIAASAIVALQERNQVMMQAKTSAIDMLAEQRSRWAIGLWQNFGIQVDFVNVSGQPTPFIGTNYAGRKFSYVVESGSTTPRTSLQNQELGMSLFEKGAIDQEGLLETLNWPDWREVLMRMAMGQLEQALQILVKAGLPQEYAEQIGQMLMQNQQMQEQAQAQQGQSGEPGNAMPSQPQPGTPKIQQQGDMNNAAV